MPETELLALPPVEAIRYFEGKGFRPSFDWQEVWQEEHARHFTVAKAMRYDVLADLRQGVDQALRDGTTFAQFKRELTPLLEAKGWWGKQDLVDPRTGEPRTVQLGSPRRLATIYDVNLRTAYAAGRWERIERTAEARPFLRYVATLDSRTRPQHRAWHGTVLPFDHPFWETHYPPNGWRCRCTVQQLSARDLERFGYEESEAAPPIEASPWRNPRTGETIDVPLGIDPGWGYNVGRAHMRGVTPPPASGPLELPATRPPRDLPMPTPRAAAADRLLPEGLSDEEYVNRFLAEFGATASRPALFRDVLDEPMLVGREMFVRRSSGTLKVSKRGRERYLGLIADTIRQPDEVWWTWQTRRRGKPELIRRYFARWDVDGESVPIVVVFEVGKHGWSGLTSFRATDVELVLRRRGGTLAWRRSR